MNPPREALSSPVETPVMPARHPISSRGKWVGALIAVAALAGLGGLTWYLTRPDAAPAAGPGGASSARGSGAPGGSAAAGGPGAVPGGSRGASTVGVATAEKASVPVSLDALGTVTPLATVKVKPQVSGVLSQVLFNEGQMVKKGDLLAKLDARQFELALAQATGQRQRDTALLDSAKVTLARFKTLLEQDSIARQEVDSQTALVKQLEGTVLVNNAAVSTAQLNLSYTRITAPINGRAGLRTVDVGNTVSSSDANGVAVITQVMPVDVVFAVPQDRISDVLNAAKSDMQVMALDRTRTGVLGSGTFASLDNQVDTATGTVKAKARFANADQALFANQFVNIQLRIKSIDNAVVVPVTAVRLGGNGDFVFVLNAAERTVSVRPVVRGQAAGEKIVIASGLKVGEQVITEGADRLKEGSRVALAGEAPRGGGRRPGASAAPSAAQGAPVPASSAPAPSASPPVAALPTADKAAPAQAAFTQPPVNLPPVNLPPVTQPPVTTAPQAAAKGTASALSPPGPTAEQRQRMLEQVKDNPEALERRKRFIEKLDSGDKEALERWQSMQQRMLQGGGPASGAGSAGPQRPPP